MPSKHYCAASAALVSSFLIGLASSPASAATLVAFDFDDPGGLFEAQPDHLAEALLDAHIELAGGPLDDVAGNPGRALVVDDFIDGNRIELHANLRPGWRVRVTRIGFDQRASASGPQTWTLSQGTSLLATGATTSAFESVSQVVDFLLTGDTLALAIGGSGASSARGTLRLDNLFVEGEAQPVPLPAAAALVALPLLGLSRARSRPASRKAIRARHRAAGNTGRA